MDRRRRLRLGMLGCMAALVLCAPAPAALAQDGGRFEAGPVEQVRVVAHDGVVLNGWVRRPVTDEKVPAILHSSPYIGECGLYQSTYPFFNDRTDDMPCATTPDDDSWWTRPSSTWAWVNGLFIEPIRFVEAGYAVAYFDVRGTGLSGGCLEFMGANEQRDQTTLVNWLAGRQWSNERVAMGGASYMSATAWEAAVKAPAALKTIVVAGSLADLYTLLHTPQGAQHTLAFPEFAYLYGASTLAPSKQALVPPGGDAAATGAWASQVEDRACDDVRDSAIVSFIRALATEGVVDPRGERNPEFWEERNLLDDFRGVKASVLLAHGFRDFGHGYQEELTWANVRSPVWQLEGQWGHTFPVWTGLLPSEWGRAGHEDCAEEEIWCQKVFDWLAYWLKGEGQRPRTGVDYQDDRTVPYGWTNVVRSGNGTIDEWHRSSAWPPPAARSRVLYLRGSTLTATPGPGERTFLSTQRLGETEPMFLAMCADESQESYPFAATYFTDPLPETVDLAGEPFAYLSLSNGIKDDGLITVSLFEIDPERFNCDETALDGPAPGSRLLSTGIADLRYHSGGYTAKPFEDGPVRVDLQGLASRITAGHRLALVASYGDFQTPKLASEPSGASPLTVHATGTRWAPSQLVLPVTDGAIGSKPAAKYPPRPFAP